MPDPVYALVATDCPEIQVPSSLLDPVDVTPTTASTITAGASGPGSQSTPVNRNAVRLDNVGRYGGAFAYCVKQGLELSASGLTLTVGEGHAGIDAGLHLDAQTTAAPDNALSWVWLNISGTPVLGTSLSVPSGGKLYRGRCRFTSGTLSEIDYSGVLFLRGGTLWRRTADAAAPTDTPPATIQFVARTLGGHYWWDGVEYTQLSGTVEALTSDLESLQTQLDDLARLFRRLLFSHVTTLNTLPSGLEDEFTRSVSEQ